MKIFAAALLMAFSTLPSLAQDLTRSEALALRDVMTRVDQARWRYIDALRAIRGSRIVQVRWFDRKQDVEQLGPDTFRLWLRTDYAPPMTSGRLVIGYSIDQTEWNCRSSQVRYGPTRTFGTDGKALANSDDWEAWHTMRPGSVGEAQLETLCRLIRSGKLHEEKKQ